MDLDKLQALPDVPEGQLDILPQAVEILASLASLGISEHVRTKVQTALADLTSATDLSKASSTHTGRVRVRSCCTTAAVHLPAHPQASIRPL